MSSSTARIGIFGAANIARALRPAARRRRSSKSRPSLAETRQVEVLCG